MIGKILSKFDGSGYYMELEGEGDEGVVSLLSQAPTTAVDPAEAEGSTVAKAAGSAESTAESSVESTDQPSASTATASDAPAAPESAAAPVTAAPAPDPVDIIRAALAKSSTPAEAASTEEETASVGTFATDYLISTRPSPRRRPGPSMAMFKKMAKEYK